MVDARVEYVLGLFGPEYYRAREELGEAFIELRQTVSALCRALR